MIKTFAFWVSILAVALAVLAGFGSRFGLWHFRTGFSILKISAYAGLAGAIIALGALALERSGSRVQAIFAVLIGLGVFSVPWNYMRTAKKVPVIHDISTNTSNPPAFVAVLPLRKDALNPAEYGGAEIAEKQKAAYPDIIPLDLKMPADQAFSKALAAAKKMGWEIVDADAKDGRIEATDMTFWFGFKDDIIVRVAGEKDGSRIDVRSVSRVGKGDVGTNAKRIRKYTKELNRLG